MNGWRLEISCFTCFFLLILIFLSFFVHGGHHRHVLGWNPVDGEDGQHTHTHKDPPPQKKTKEKRTFFSSAECFSLHAGARSGADWPRLDRRQIRQNDGGGGQGNRSVRPVLLLFFFVNFVCLSQSTIKESSAAVRASHQIPGKRS